MVREAHLSADDLILPLFVEEGIGAPVPVASMPGVVRYPEAETEARLLRSLRRAGEGRTVVISAHRLATVKDADQILCLDEGKVDAMGTHEELLERSPWYRETWDRQRMQEELQEL